MKYYDINSKDLLLQNTLPFKSESIKPKENKIIKNLLDKYIIKDMNDWVDGYIEWSVSEYEDRIQELLGCVN